MKIGSMFAGIGGLDLAVEAAFGATTSWQLDQVGADVRSRHWPAATQVSGDVRKINPADLERVDILCGGFPCQDLSQAGTRAGLAGERSGLYREMVRFAEALSPTVIVLENVPALFTKYREVLEGDLRAAGYGLTWVRARALDAGAPHRRSRVFVVARRGKAASRVLNVPRVDEWTGSDEAPWPTPTASNPNEGEDLRGLRKRSEALVAMGSRPLSMPLGMAVRAWPTPVANDAKGGGGRGLESSAHPGESLTDAVTRPWPTPLASDANRAGLDRQGHETLGQSVRTWPTPMAADAQTSGAYPRGNPTLGAAVKLARPWATPVATDFKAATKPEHRRFSLSGQVTGNLLNPEWVECLMGFPVGWSRRNPALSLFRDGWTRGQHSEAVGLLQLPKWPRGRPPKGWPESDWPGFPWEPPRTTSSSLDRCDRLRFVGNAVVPREAYLALMTALNGSAA